MRNILIVLLGPTGTGKTDLAVNLALRFESEIISADSRQIFREMKIGTAVPSDQQLLLIKHHFIRSISIQDYYNSSIFEKDVLDLLPSLFSKNNIAIMSGGSGMYIDAVCNGIDDIPDTDMSIREKYISMYMNEGIESLRIALRLVDPEHYSKVDLKNQKRIMRALEICESTGRPYSSFLKKQKRQRDFEIIKVGLKREREDLYNRINSRVDEMVHSGLEEEAASLMKYRELNALKCVGYREFFDFFDGKITREKAIELIKRNSRRYAKRQMTWWDKDKDINWFHPEHTDGIMSFLTARITF